MPEPKDTAGQEASTPDPAKAAAPPAFDAEAKIRELATTNEQRFGELTGKIDQLTSALLQKNNEAPLPAKTARKRITQEEIDAAFADGKHGAAVMAAVSNMEEVLSDKITEALSNFNKDVVAPIRNTGFSALEGVVDEVTKTKMPHLSRFKKEYDGYIAALPPELRLNAAVRLEAYNNIVGKNINAIVEEEVQKRLRESQEPADNISAGSGSGRSVNGGKGTGLPTPEDIFGKDGLETLRLQGYPSAEDFVKKRGHKDWASYCDMIRKQEETVNV